jgi:hypothetical protein
MAAKQMSLGITLCRCILIAIPPSALRGLQRPRETVMRSIRDPVRGMQRFPGLEGGSRAGRHLKATAWLTLGLCRARHRVTIDQ